VFNDGAFDALRDKKQGMVNRILLEHGQPIRSGEFGVVRGEFGELGSSRWRTSARTSWSSTTRTATTRRWPSRCRGCRRCRTGRRRSASSVRSRARSPGAELTPKLAAARAAVDDTKLDAALRAADTWTIA
jgi:2-oxoglutarate ferredoxin oxidoreductase subunit beta